METGLIVFSFVTVTIAISCFFKSNQCTDEISNDENSPIGLYWLLAIVSSALALFTSVVALGAYNGTLIWLLLHSIVLIPTLIFSPLRLSRN